MIYEIALLIIGFIIWPICTHLTLENFKKKLNKMSKVMIFVIPHIGILLCLLTEFNDLFLTIGGRIIGICFVIAMISIPINILYYIYRKI